MPMTVQGRDVMVALQAVFDAVPKAKRRAIFMDEAVVETMVRSGAVAIPLLKAIRAWLLDPVTQGGGEDSPFVQRIDAIIPR